MVQIINTILIGFIVSGIYNLIARDKNKIIKITVTTICCVLYFILFSISSNLLLTFGPGAALVIFSYIDYGLKKKSRDPK